MYGKQEKSFGMAWHGTILCPFYIRKTFANIVNMSRDDSTNTLIQDTSSHSYRPVSNWVGSNSDQENLPISLASTVVPLDRSMNDYEAFIY